MNGIPLDFDFSKTLNEQLLTFDYYKSRYANYEWQLLNLSHEKQQLISFLEEKIKECNKNIDEFFSTYGKATINNTEIKRKAFQEVLDFVKGGKDE